MAFQFLAVLLAMLLTGSAPSQAAQAPVRSVIAGDLPYYPGDEQLSGTHGVVTLELDVKNGRVSAVRVKSGNRYLAEASEKIVRTWRLEESFSGAVPVRFTFTIRHSKVAAPGLASIKISYPADGSVDVELLAYRPPPISIIDIGPREPQSSPPKSK